MTGMFYRTTFAGVKIIAPTAGLLDNVKSALLLIPKKYLEPRSTIFATPGRADRGFTYSGSFIALEAGGLRTSVQENASTIVHEMAHVRQQREGRKWAGDRAEHEAFLVQVAFLNWLADDCKDLVRSYRKQIGAKHHERKGNRPGDVTAIDRWIDKLDGAEGQRRLVMRKIKA